MNEDGVLKRVGFPEYVIKCINFSLICHSVERINAPNKLEAEKFFRKHGIHKWKKQKNYWICSHCQNRYA
jgi:hypothetical protein